MTSIPPKRPISPHWTVWRFHFTMISSVTHRITGVATIAGLVMVTAWLVCLALGRHTYEVFVSLASSPIGMIVWFGTSFAFFIHFMGGIRHLVWDLGHMLHIRKAEQLTILTQVLAFALTIAFWTALILSHKISL